MTKGLIQSDIIENKIFLIRGQKVMLDRDLSELYGVETRVLNQAVRRNLDRFPEDFMFQLTNEEMKNWMSQFVISNQEKMGVRKRPHAFTEQGVAMLSSVLRSKQAIHVNIAIMRAFVKIRHILTTSKELVYKLIELEDRLGRHDREIKAIFKVIRELMRKPEKPKRQIGFYRY